MSAEVVGIERSEDRSENSFQPQAVSGRRRSRDVKERRVDRHESVRAAQRRQAARCRRTNSHLCRRTVNDWPSSVSKIVQTRCVTEMGTFRRMLMVPVMAQALSQRPSDTAVSKHKRKQNYRDSFHGDR